MQTPKFNKQLQSAIYLILIFCVLAIGVFFFATKPMTANLRDTQAKYNAKKIEKAEKEKKVSDLKTLKNKLDDYKSQSDFLIKALPIKEDVPGILVQVEALFVDMKMPMESFSLPTATSSNETTSPKSGSIGLEATQSQAKTPTTTYSVSKLNFSLATSGSYGQIINFMTALQNNLRIIRITDFSLTPAEEGANFSFSCTVQMYYLSKGSTGEGTEQ